MEFFLTWTYALLIQYICANAVVQNNSQNFQHITKPQLYYAYSQYTKLFLANSLKREFKLIAPSNTKQMTLFHSTKSNTIKPYQTTLDYQSKYFNVFEYDINWNSLISSTHGYGTEFSFTGEFPEKKYTLENKLNVDDGILGDNVDCVLYEGYIDEYLTKAILKGKIIVRPFKNQKMFVQYKSAFGHGNVEAYKLYEMPSEFECWTFDVVIQGRATNVYDVEVHYEYENENGVNVSYVDDNFERRYKIYKEGIYDNM